MNNAQLPRASTLCALDLDTVGVSLSRVGLHDDAIRLQLYEQLAQNPQAEVKDLLAFCNLLWEAQCLQVENNTLPVSTASKVQVREPINTRSIGRWKRYELQTEALQKSLGII